MRRCTAILALAFMAGAAMAREVDLTMTERAGHPRVNEPVRIGVPLPEGAAKSADAFTLVDETGMPIPCQFTPVSRWLKDDSIKWVHCDFLTSVDSGATRRLKLMTDAGKNPKPAATLSVEEKAGLVTVTNGNLVVRIRGDRFGFFAGAAMPQSLVLDRETGGILLETERGTYSSALDAAGTATVESQGPVRVVVKCEGALKNAAGEKALDYVVRFAFCAGSPRVDAAFTFVNRRGAKPADKQVLRDLSILIPTAAPEGALRVIGTERAPVVVPFTPPSAPAPPPGTKPAPAPAAIPALKTGEALSIFQETSDSYFVFTGADSTTAGLNRWAGRTLARGRGKSTKPVTTGWGAVLWPGGGVAVGSRWFWQSCPSVVELRADGVIRLGLFPREGGATQDVYMGQARTHYLTFVFGPETPERLNDVYAGVQQPLRPFPSPEYLCRTAAPFGLIAESSRQALGDIADRVDSYDRALRETVEVYTRRLDGCLHTGRGALGAESAFTRAYFIDGYGYWAWGDIVLWTYMNEEYPWTNSWNGNYYDFSFALLLQWMRTADPAFLDPVEPNTMHEADIFTVNWHPQAHLVGACRYCPPRNHIGNENAGPYISREFNHHKAQSTFALWYLFGNERMRDVALLKLNNALTNREADNGWGQIRGPGAQLATLYEGYEYTHDRKYLERMQGMIARARERLAKSGPDSFAHSEGKFMYGIGIEGMIYEYWLTGNPETLVLARALVDYLIESKQVTGVTPNITFGLAYLYHTTGDAKYKEYALRILERSRAYRSGEAKSFGQSWRNSARALYYLSAPPNVVYYPGAPPAATPGAGE